MLDGIMLIDRMPVHEIPQSAERVAAFGSLDRTACVGIGGDLGIELRSGGDIIYGNDDEVMISGTVVEHQNEVKLVHTFRFGPQFHTGTKGDPDTLVTYELQKSGSYTLLKLTHSGFLGDNQTRADISGGWPHILQNLKTMLESVAIHDEHEW